jgi:LDH2 family malate/lactate/ureidoglycolate dehydrogenase
MAAAGEGRAPVRVAAEALEAWAAAAFSTTGMPAEDSAAAAQVLVRSSLRGMDSHGVSRIPPYVKQLGAGDINPRPQHSGTTRDGTLFYACDGGLGQVVAMAAVRKAVKLAENRPVVPCFIEECGHLAAIGIFALAAAEAGMVALVCQSTKPWMALPGWQGRGIGNNPLGFAAPLAGRPPLVFDMAASVAARGAVVEAAREGTDIPAGWALDTDGLPTEDAAAALAGAMLPVGGYKGMGLAMLVEVLSASLVARNAAPDYQEKRRPSAFLLVINPALTAGTSFAANMDIWLERYLAAGSGEGARYPGARAAECEAERRAAGIPVAPALAGQLRALGEDLGIPFPGT